MIGIWSLTASWLNPFSKPSKTNSAGVEVFQPTLTDRITAMRCEIPQDFDLKDEALRLDLALNRVTKYLKTHPKMVEEFSKTIASLESKLDKTQYIGQAYREFTDQIFDAIKNADRALLDPTDVVEVEEKDELGGHYKVRCQIKYMNGRKFLFPIEKLPIVPPTFIIGLCNYPSLTATPAAYKLSLQKCVKGCEEQPGSHITGLLNSPTLNIPSGIEIETGSTDPLIVYHESYKDILRLQKVTLNDELIFDQEAVRKMTCSPDSKIRKLYKKTLKAFGNDATLVQNLFKISNQAMMVGITGRIHQKFMNDKIGILVVGGGITVNVRLFWKEEDKLEIRYTTLYRILDTNSEKVINHIKGIREIVISRENLRSGNADQAIVRDFTILTGEEVPSKG